MIYLAYLYLYMFNDIHFKAKHFLSNAKLCRTNAYEFQYTIAELHIFFAASLQLLCSYFETTLHLCHGKQLLIELDWRIRIYMYISVTLIHSSKCIKSHSRRRWEEVILKSAKRQIGYTSDTYPLLLYYKYCREISSQSSEISLMTFLIFYTTVSFYAIKSHLKTLHSTSGKAAIKMNYSLCQTAQPWN